MLPCVSRLRSPMVCLTGSNSRCSRGMTRSTSHLALSRRWSTRRCSSPSKQAGDARAVAVASRMAPPGGTNTAPPQRTHGPLSTSPVQSQAIGELSTKDSTVVARWTVHARHESEFAGIPSGGKNMACGTGATNASARMYGHAALGITVLPHIGGGRLGYTRCQHTPSTILALVPYAYHNV